jgi:hypothetical protein
MFIYAIKSALVNGTRSRPIAVMCIMHPTAAEMQMGTESMQHILIKQQHK